MVGAIERFVKSIVSDVWTYYFLIVGIIIGIVYYFGGKESK